MRAAVREFVQRAHMIEMDVRGDGEDGVAAQAGKSGELGHQGSQAGACIDQQVAIAPKDVPDVGAREGVNVRLPQAQHAVPCLEALIPLGCDRQGVRVARISPARE